MSGCRIFSNKHVLLIHVCIRFSTHQVIIHSIIAIKKISIHFIESWVWKCQRNKKSFYPEMIMKARVILLNKILKSCGLIQTPVFSSKLYNIHLQMASTFKLLGNSSFVIIIMEKMLSCFAVISVGLVCIELTLPMQC